MTKRSPNAASDLAMWAISSSMSAEFLDAGKFLTAAVFHDEAGAVIP
jgi:hypothetical protein